MSWFRSRRENSYKIDTVDNDIPIMEFIKHNKTALYNVLKKKQTENLLALDYTIKTLESRKIIMAKKMNECPICFDNNVDTCMVPCGHTFCHGCVETATKCYLCNQEIFIKQKIYL